MKTLRKMSFAGWLLLCSILCTGLQAQTVLLSGQIEDGFLKIPLDDVRVRVLTADSAVVADSASITRVISGKRLFCVLWSAKIKAGKGTYLVHASRPGYTDAWQRVEVSSTSSKEVNVPVLQLRRVMDRTLGTATVKATKVKMYYKGDTLVYNADAFQLPDGSMLDALIRQLPGVKLNEDGEIFVNGRKIDELLLGARSFMNGKRQVMMENLPYYTVKDIKVYDKRTDRSEALGYDVEPSKYVMDVHLKPEYNRGCLAHVEAAAGTEKRWLGRGFLLGFIGNLRVSLLGNLNNVNETRHIGESGHWTPQKAPRSLTTVRSGAVEIDYHTKEDRLKENFYAEYTSTTDHVQMRERREQFLDGRMPTSVSEYASRNGTRKLFFSNNLSLKQPFYARLSTRVDYLRRDGSFNSVFDQWDDTLTVSQRSVGTSEGKAWQAQAHLDGDINLNRDREQHLAFNVSFEHTTDKSESAERYALRHAETAAATLQHNAGDISRRQTKGRLSLTHEHRLLGEVGLTVADELSLSRFDTHDWLYHPDTLLLPSQLDLLNAITDYNNSYDSDHWLTRNVVRLSLFERGYYKFSPESPVRVSYNKWNVSLSLPYEHASLDYCRGAVDTLARQNDLLVNASANYTAVWRNGRQKLQAGWDYGTGSASLADRISFRDDSHPLVVKLGNPDLKGTSVSKLYVRYEDKSGKNMQQFNANASFNYHHRSVAQSVMYDPLSGVYTYRPMNIGGSYEVDGKFGISRAIDRAQCWTWQTELKGSYWHSVDHAMLSGETASRRNTVNTTTVEDDLWLQYRKNSLYVKAAGNVSWRHSEGRMQDFSTLDALDFRYGLNAGYTLPRINTTLAMDANVYSRRGYGSADLNTDHFILNASLSQSFLKGKLIARVEGFDLLHQLSNTQYSVNAQGRVETWYRSLPRYVMFHLVYHWNKAPKKK